MYKNIIPLILIFFMAACSAPKPKHPPSWSINPPKDSKFIYAAGSSKNTHMAREKAIDSMRESIRAQADNIFQEKTHTLHPIDERSLALIREQNRDISKKLSLKRAKIIKSEEFNGDIVVLISIPREELFKKIELISDTKYNRFRQNANLSRGAKELQRFLSLDAIIDGYPTLSSYAAYKEFLAPKYNSDEEFNFLKSVKSEYDTLKKSINIYILTDVNSRFFSPIIRDAIRAKDISTENISDAKNALKLLITSTTEESQEYSFNKSRSLLKMTIFDKSKNIISFRQHTFIGRSRKDHLDAKRHAASNLKYKVKKLGIFDFIGIKE